jgi:MHS family proline/betaine transporter-like MFS transporter
MSRASIVIAAFSTIVEWYDFTLYLYFATVLARVFFGRSDAALAAALAGFAVAYILRPVGAIIFAHVGDRFGRRRSLLLSVALITVGMFATALLPTHAQSGAAAGWLLILVRCLMGFSVGGEYCVIVSYLLEGASPGRRGLVTSLASAASEVGGLLAVGVCYLVVTKLDASQLNTWGWRIPFFVGAALAISVWIARSAMQESPDFERQQVNATVPDMPFLYTLSTQRVGLLRAFTISALGSVTYYVGITYIPVYLTSAGKMTESTSFELSTIAAVVVILITPLTGILSDRLGRKPVLVGLAGLGIALPIAMFQLMGSGSHLLAMLGAAVMAGVAGAVSAVGAAATAEQFPGEGRISGLALGATTATVIFGGLTPFLAQVLIGRTGLPIVPGIMIAAVALCVLPVFFAMPETVTPRLDRGDESQRMRQLH